MKYNVSKIMKRAWEIKREHADNIFALCLKMAWAEAKAPKVGLSEDEVAKLVKIGFNRWTKAGMDRLYINATALGLDCDYYKTGNIHGAEWCGERISNSLARTLKAAKTYVDVKTGKLYSGHDWLREEAQKLLDSIAA